MLILIDADPIVYRCGFAAETSSWHIVYETNKAEADEIEFHADDVGSAGDHMREWLAFNDGRVTVLDKSRVVHPDPVSYALRATKVQVESIIEECTAKFGPCKSLMFLSGRGGSFRDRIATVRPYKGNRDPSHKPFHYDAIRDYLCTHYGATLTRGIEADDAVSIFAHNQLAKGGESYVVATIDKDLDQIPGHHYNYMNKVFYAITETEAERWFIYQILAGDTTDNIVGVWKCGPKQAVGILNGLRLDAAGVKQRSARTDGGNGGADRSGHTANDAEHAATSAGATPVRSEHGQLHVPGDSLGAARAAVGEHGEPPSDAASELRGQPHGSVRAVGSSAGAASEHHYATDVPDGQPAQPNGPSKLPPRRSPPWWPTVVRAYAESQSRPGCPYAKDNAEAVAIEMAQLVKLQEYPGQLWHPHGDLVIPGFGEENFDD